MKIYKNIIGQALLCIALISSCDVLDQELKNEILAENAIVDAKSAEAALNGLYSAAEVGDLYGGRFIMANEMLSKNAIQTGFQAYWVELASGIVPSSNAHMTDYWVSAYNVINAANNILLNAPKVGLSSSSESRILGTAYFFRAMMSFDLLRQFGEFYDLNSKFGIPLSDQPIFGPVEIERSSVSASYDFILSDLDMALDLLATSGDKYYVSLNAAKALKARVALYSLDYETAAKLASEIIADPVYSLEGYNDVYNVSEASSESIFEFKFVKLTSANAWGIEMYTNPAEVSVRKELYDFFVTNNETVRGNLFIQNGETYRCLKYGSKNTDDNASTIAFRLSEMYLIRAEALALKADGTPNSAEADINTIRNRAGMGNISTPTNEALIDALLYERRAEFAFEGHYWFDMVRLGRMESITGRDAFRKIMPIPLREMTLSKNVLIQNPMY